VSTERNSAERRAAGARDLARSRDRDAPIQIVDYDEAWPERFLLEQSRLVRLVPGIDLHHIGSTAVPGLAAKPIIDMMAVVADLDAPLPALIEQAGYQFPTAYNATLVERRWLCRPSASHRTHHLHLVTRHDELTRHLQFRDALRAQPDLMREYAALKYQLSKDMTDDREGYTAAKTTFIQRVEASF
jgi:GrpB-like predicted nucleotidyltransferase (UPF0157 family)